MIRGLFGGKLKNIPVEERINLIFDVLLPATYLEYKEKKRRSIRKFNFYLKEVKRLLEKSNMEVYKRQEIEYRLRTFENSPDLSDTFASGDLEC